MEAAITATLAILVYCAVGGVTVKIIDWLLKEPTPQTLAPLVVFFWPLAVFMLVLWGVLMLVIPGWRNRPPR